MSFGQYIVWLLFLFTCLQQAFLFPYVTVIPGERANLFSGILCFVTFLAGSVILKSTSIGIRGSEIIISIILSALAFTSSIVSFAPGVSLPRSFVIISSMLGGYWVARLLLNTVQSRLFFTRCCIGLLLGVVILAFAGLLSGGTVHQFIDSGYHQVASRIFLFSFAPISFLFSASVPIFWIGVTTLWLSSCCLIAVGYAEIRSAVAVPFVISFLAMVFLTKTKRLIIILSVILAISLLGTYALYHWHPQKMTLDYQGLAYRIENVFFSTHLALKNPLLGIGPSNPRAGYVDNYEIKYPFLSKQTFRDWSETVCTSENAFLTLLAELGFLFVILYLSALGCLLWKLAQLAWRPPPHCGPHPLALLLAIVGSFVHFQVFDGLYLPQISWFFHILLGMVLFDPPETPPNSRVI